MDIGGGTANARLDASNRSNPVIFLIMMRASDKGTTLANYTGRTS
jgi:hypothetical protein